LVVVSCLVKIVSRKVFGIIHVHVVRKLFAK
jgi:hypothetical protein